MKKKNSEEKVKGTSSKRLLLNSIIYATSGVLLKCFSFFLLPLYTAYLTTEDYGITSIATTFVNTMSFVVAFSLFSAIMRFYVDLKDDKEKLRRFYGTVSLFVIVSSVLFSGVLTLCRDTLSQYVFSGVDYYPIIMVSLISLVFFCQQTIYENILRSQQKALMSSILNIIFFFITLTLNLLFVVYWKMGAIGSLLAMMFTYISYTLFFWCNMLIKKEIIFCLDFKLLKGALKYSIPIMPHNLSTQITLLISKVLIGDTTSLASLGVYSIASQFGNVADTIQGYVDQAYGPWLYEKLHSQEEGYKKSIRGIAKLLASVLGLFFLGISLFAQDYIVLFINKEYINAWKYVPCIVMIFAIKTIYYFFVEILFYYKKASRYLFTATLSSSILNVILAFVFIPILGVWGSILADGISMILRVFIVVKISNQFGNIGLKVKDFIQNIIIVFGFISLGLILSFAKYSGSFSILNFLYKCIIVALYMLVSICLNREYVKPAIRFFKSKFDKGGK